MQIFGNFFEKNVNVFGNFLTVKWQFSGGSGLNHITSIKLMSDLGEVAVGFVRPFVLASQTALTVPLPTAHITLTMSELRRKNKR